METVLIVGASGNIGVSAIVGALRQSLHVLAIVRSRNSAEKLFQHVGTRNGITIVEADVMSESGVQSVVDMVKSGSLPAFQHVYSTGNVFNFILSAFLEVLQLMVFISVGLYDRTSPIQTLDLSTFREVMRVNLEANFRKSRHKLSRAATLHATIL